MQRILVTGATGNVGYDVIRFLSRLQVPVQIVAGVRNVENARQVFKDFPALEFVQFDFEQPATFTEALNNIDRVFLLRPPQIAKIKKYFDPLFVQMQKQQVKQVVFLSVQGAEKSKIIPHHKIEQSIKAFGFDYIFLRPGYFMQNLTTTLLTDIREKQQIVLPAGKAKFNWIDVENISEAAAILLHEFEHYKNRAFELTGYENEDFYAVSQIITENAHVPVTFKNVNPLRFYFIKRRTGMPKGKILVMIMLHFLPRFQSAPHISDFYEQLTNKAPTSLKTFVARERVHFTP